MKKHAAFKWKDAISGFLVSSGSAEALVRCGWKIKYILIACFLGNIYAKNCRNRTVYVKIIASCKVGTFFETQCIFYPIASSHRSTATSFKETNGPRSIQVTSDVQVIYRAEDTGGHLRNRIKILVTKSEELTA